MSHPFDTLGFSRKLIEGGMGSEEAALTTALFAAAITEATDAKADEARIDAKLAELRSELRREIADTNAKLAELRADLRREIAEGKVETIKWVVGIGLGQIVALVGLVFGLLKLFPTSHP